MSAEARYFRVGIFVFAGIALILASAILLGGGDLFKQTLMFETYFDESVQGLEVGSPVKLRGVQLGSVKEIGFVDDYYPLETEEEVLEYGNLVMVLIEVADPPEEGVSREQRERNLQQLIERGMRMRLASQGITGTSFIEANYVDPQRRPPMKIIWTPKNYYIPSTPSPSLTTIASSAQKFFERLETVDVERLVEDADTLLIRLTEAVDGLDTGRLREEGSQLISDLQRTSAELRTSVDEADVPALTASARETMEQATATLVRVQRMVEGGRYDLELALENLRIASENLRDVTDTAREYPSLLLLGEPPKPSKAATQ